MKGFDVAAGTVHLYRTDVNRRLELKARVAAGDRVTVHRAKFNRGQMTQAADRITRDAKVLGDQRISVQMVYDNDATDVGAISVTSMTDWVNLGPAEPASGQIYVGSWASPIVGEFLCQGSVAIQLLHDLFAADQLHPRLTGRGAGR